MKALTRALLVLNVLYCLLAAVQEGIPGWHMFESVEPLDHELRDRAGERVDVRAWLPRGANLVDRSELRRVVAFVCEKEAARAPFTYVEPGTGVDVRLDSRAGPGGCKVHVPR
ncbi:hypothetical protein BH11MYX4_BH11MYX4_60650 [soil metagenome]